MKNTIDFILKNRISIVLGLILTLFEKPELDNEVELILEQ